ncbi:MAG: DUF6521 family protein [Alphaproteobacteria bacterium]|nr:DUF6521 family protein [Alphaproteobacteria bacterium]
MSSIVDALYHLKFHPFKYGEYVASFYSSANDVEANLLLAPLVIPLCSHHVFAEKLKNVNRRSSLWSVFDDRAMLYDLQERIDEFKGLTEQCIQYCLLNDWLEIDSKNLMLHYSANTSTSVLQRNAVNLGRLVNGHSVVEVYAFLGVRPQ